MAQHSSSQVDPRVFIDAIHGFRYQVKDVARAVGFYIQRLGFTLKHQQFRRSPTSRWETRTSS